MKKITAVIFDWAGTSVDFGCFAPVEAFSKAFERFGILPSAEELRAPMGMLKWDHIHTMLQMPRIRAAWKEVHGSDWTRDDVDAVYARSEAAIFEILHLFAEPKPYVLETVRKLRERGIKIGSTTGYTDKMMAIVVPKAAEQGYAPDCWFSPNAVGECGRPYPFMLFRNLETLNIPSVANVLKIGDTVSDILEGKNAGVLSVGVVEGSSIMGLTLADFEALSAEEKAAESQRVRSIFEDCGADYVIENMSDLESLIEQLETGD